MSRRNLHYLLQKYLDGICCDSEKELIDGWLTLLDNDDYWKKINKEDLPVIEKKLWNKLQSSISLSNTEDIANTSTKKYFWLIPLLKVAAVLAIIIVGGIMVYKQSLSSSLPITNKVFSANWIKKTNNKEIPLNVILEDGSVIKLNSGAAIYYPLHFDADKREVRLEGTAFFEVMKNPKKPFYVYSNKIVTRVLGTSFWIKCDVDNNQAAVEVVTGKVSVYRIDATNTNNGKKEGVILKPNEKVTFDQDKEGFVTSLVDIPIPLKQGRDSANSGKNDVFDESSLSYIIAVLEKEYGINIVVENDEMNNRLFTGDLSGLDYFNKLKLICKSVDASYEIQVNRILLKRGK